MPGTRDPAPAAAGRTRFRLGPVPVALACLLLVLAGAGAYLLTVQSDRGGGIGGPFALQDGGGKTVSDKDFRGKWMLVYFGYTHCPDACPTALNDIANAMDLLGPGKRDVAPVFITVDPERDTPAVMKDYVSSFDTPITALSGTPAQVDAAIRAYRVYAAKHPTRDGYDMDHSSIIYLMDKRGRFVANFTHETPPERIAAKLKELGA